MGRASIGAGLILSALFVLIWTVPLLVAEQGETGAALVCSGVVTALVASALAAVAAIGARRAGLRQEADLIVLARSIDMAMKDILARTGQNAVEIETVAAALARYSMRQSQEIEYRPMSSSHVPPRHGLVNGRGVGVGVERADPASPRLHPQG